ncbi:HEAT repeat domain-containing protein [Aeoliella sp. ICT_H6.2]|uniref:HEAT repeat domain-containing protein n=1 Tax=Aeoliella straminimaris TaxID=2954799 RepID=A0A9X2JG78_9BACT|nr:HEAT repeat domain-containing protein [Aeoliella straminimaris]
MAHNRFRIPSVLVALQFCCLAAAQQPEQPATVPDDADKLVAQLSEGDLDWESSSQPGLSFEHRRRVSALVAMKDEALPALKRGLESDDLNLRLNCVYILREIDTPASLEMRIALISDDHPRVRARAVAGLGRYNSHEARSAVLAAFKDPDPGVRSAAVRSVPRDREKLPRDSYSLLKALVGLLNDKYTQRDAARVLGNLEAGNASRPLLRLLRSPDSRVRIAAIQAEGKIKDKSVAPDLTVTLSDEDHYVRMYAAMALGELGDMRATSGLVAALADQEIAVRRESARALGRIGDRRAIPPLIKALDDSSGAVRGAAAEALGEIGDPAAGEALSRLLLATPEDGATDKAKAAEALGKLGDPRAISPLKEYLRTLEPRHDRDGCEAAAALAQIRHPRAIAALVELFLESPHNNIRGACRGALGQAVGNALGRGEDVEKWWDENGWKYQYPLPDQEQTAE